jgi:hypothetical protein
VEAAAALFQTLSNKKSAKNLLGEECAVWLKFRGQIARWGSLAFFVGEEVVMKLNKFQILIIIQILLLSIINPALAMPSYRISELPYLFNGEPITDRCTQPYAINNFGDITGDSNSAINSNNSPPYYTSAFFYSNGSMINITPYEIYPYYYYAGININDKQEIIGTF